MAWSPYGKQPGRGNQVLDDFPFRMGVPLSKLSELQKWEGPDPAYWVYHGYAVVNPDPRGVYKSEGDIYAFGTQEGRDGADVVDWVGVQPWCSGKVGLSGNSYLAIAQWFIAAEHPKHLKAIAPWEGSSDYFREAAPGGVASGPALDFGLQILSVNVGENSWENPVEMLRAYPDFMPYFLDKAADVPAIDVPAYVVASWSNPIHSYGTYRAYCRLTTEKKWLRVHDAWEWPDYYDEANRADLHRFYDRFLKDVDNGWETTPRLRAKIVDTRMPLPLSGTTFSSDAFPPVSQLRPLKVFFDAGSSMTMGPGYPRTSLATFHATKSEITFEYTFGDDTTLCGPLDMQLAVSLNGNDDANVFVYTEKVGRDGSPGAQLVIPYPSPWQTTLVRYAAMLRLDPKLKLLFYRGPWGQANVARRAIVQGAEAVPGLPIVVMDTIEPVKEGKVVRLYPHMRPIGMSFRRGEKLRVTVAGVNKQVYPEVHQSELTAEGVPDPNGSGVEISVHCGANSEGVDSFLVLPVVDVAFRPASVAVE